ncbi:glycogen branching protein [Endozoicomonas montiporae]|uniref:1,4-alpha-glucan branching enzyme GlgB n=1 Tax=Endozoicomonas montiporae TaxID=1027273 RepID=A0A081N8J3_9GAMM|nr:glycogen branching protein [Endozoicomonas montiporae]
MLDRAQVSCPFDYLGIQPHDSGKGLVVRFWNPNAVSATLIQLPRKTVISTMKCLSPGLFEWHLPRRKKAFNYVIKAVMSDGRQEEIVDPYQFGEYVLKQHDIEPSALYRHLGAHLHEHAVSASVSISGTLFKVYAPNARSVSVVGSFNDWDGRIHPMASADDGIWRLFIPGVEEQALYKFELHDQQGNLLPLKADPFGRYSEQYPGLASIVDRPQRYQWRDDDWLKHRTQMHSKPMSVYEVHPGSWKRHSDGRPLSYRELAEQLIPYVRKMGFTHIELMPVNEHPYFESWGYQPVGLFAPTSRYGSPDDFKFFVDRCHQAGIGVILDWVPAHFPEDKHGLARFDGTALYEYEDTSRGFHPDWHTLIYNFGSGWVQDFLISSALFWLDEFHIDGLRVDAVASMLYLDYSRQAGEWKPNRYGGNEHLEAVTFLQRLNTLAGRYFPDCMTIAEESTSWGGVSRPVNEGGLGFGFKWNMGWMHDSLEYMQRLPEHRCYHHTELSFSMVYAYSENFVLSLSHDEVVHGKGTILDRMPGDAWQKMANLRAYYGLMFAHPGKKLLFMGNELASTSEWDVNSSLQWSLLEQKEHAGIQTLVKDLNVVYRSVPALYELDHSRDGFRWLIIDDHAQSVYAWLRRDKAGNPVVVICNMTPVVRNHYRVGVPESKGWCELINTDDLRYGGSGVGDDQYNSEMVPSHGYKQSFSLTLPPLSTLILQGI